MSLSLCASIKSDIDLFCQNPMGRSVGRASNRKVAEYFLHKAKEFGFIPQVQEFECLDWEAQDVKLSISGRDFSAFASPFSNPCEVSGILVAASTLAELIALDLSGNILFIHGELASSPLMPKNFVFYNPDEHKEIIAVLEDAKPLAIISATAKDPGLSGAVYPAPMFEDGDFDIPSVYMTVEEGECLLSHIGNMALLHSPAKRIPARALYVKAGKGELSASKILLCAHLDTKIGTPGAIDNATGTAILIALMELLQDYDSPYMLEIIPFNGEDYYAASSEMLYLQECKNDLSKILLCLNFDAIGLKENRIAYCGFNLSEQLSEEIKDVFADSSKYTEGEPWYQGDHSIFAMQGVPTMAFSSEDLGYMISELTHTEKDTPEVCDADILAKLCERIAELVRRV